MKTVVLIGGISEGSLNRRFFAEVAKLNRGAIEFTVADIASLPFYSQDIEAAPPESVAALRLLVASSDAALFVTPEYNRSIPGVLKNAIDWCSRPPALNVWRGKPAAVMGASGGAIGTFGAQQHLRAICSQLDMPVMNQPAFYFNASEGMDDDGELTARAATFAAKFLGAFEKWVGIFADRNQR